MNGTVESFCRDIPGKLARRCSAIVRRAYYMIWRRMRRHVPGRFQPYTHTEPDRYPWLFRFVAEQIGNHEDVRVLSFGCSKGDEVLALRKYFARANIKGIDINSRNIARCRSRTEVGNTGSMEFAVANSTRAEHEEYYDVILCLGVLCHSDLTIWRRERSDPLMRFADFERTVADFARCLKPGGLLLLFSVNFRFCDTPVADYFETILEADPDQLGSNLLYDRANRLIPGAKYRPVVFRKRAARDGAQAQLS
jgi:SAM-dependent methyltransferase